MQGTLKQQFGAFSYVRIEDRIPKAHPIRRIRSLANEILRAISPELASMYSPIGRPSIPPEQLLLSLLLMALFSVPSEARLMERLEYDLLFRWFVGLDLDDAVWDATVFTKNRDRLLEHEVCSLFLAGVVAKARELDLLSNDHFSVDGTQLAAWASLTSFRPKDGSGGDGKDFRGQTRTNDTHGSTTEPEAMLYRKGDGKEAVLSYLGHALMENRHGLLVNVKVTPATGTAEREAALDLVDEHLRAGASLGADKGYDVADFVNALRKRRIKPHVCAKKKGSAIDGRTTKTEGYGKSVNCRRRIERIFGWEKTTGGMRRLRLKGLACANMVFQLVGAAYNLMRMAKLRPEAA
jgi:transposase